MKLCDVSGGINPHYLTAGPLGRLERFLSIDSHLIEAVAMEEQDRNCTQRSTFLCWLVKLSCQIKHAIEIVDCLLKPTEGHVHSSAPLIEGELPLYSIDSW